MYPKKLLIYMVMVEIVAGVVLAWSAPAVVAHFGFAFGVFGLAIIVASLYAIEMIRGHGSVSVQLPVLFASSVILGPASGAWLGALFNFSWRELSGKVRWPSILFNRAQFALVGWVSGELFRTLGGSMDHLSIGRTSFPLAVSTLAAFVLNLGFVTVAIALRQDRSIREIWRVYIRWSVPGFLLMLPIGYLMAAVYRFSGPLPELAFLIPLAGSRWIFALIKSVRDMYNHGVRIILAGLDAKDPYTYGHSMRVGHYAMLLARKMKLPEDVVEQVRHAGMLHDIGKIGTPDPILNKPGRLSVEEMLVMHRHPIIGSAMLTQVRLAGCARNWVLHHHERWDGQGYPDHLQGEEIPLETRIISVVDAYDAMTSDRPYRRAMLHDEAIEEIVAGSGTQFDDLVVQQFLELSQEINLAAQEGSGHGWDRSPNIVMETVPVAGQDEPQDSDPDPDPDPDPHPPTPQESGSSS